MEAWRLGGLEAWRLGGLEAYEDLKELHFFFLDQGRFLVRVNRLFFLGMTPTFQKIEVFFSLIEIGNRIQALW